MKRFKWRPKPVINSDRFDPSQECSKTFHLLIKSLPLLRSGLFCLPSIWYLFQSQLKINSETRGSGVIIYGGKILWKLIFSNYNYIFFQRKRPIKWFIKRPSPFLQKPRSCPSAPETLLSSSFLGEILLQKRSKYQKKIFLQNRSKYHDYHLAVMVGRLGLVMKRPTQTIYNWM